MLENTQSLLTAECMSSPRVALIHATPVAVEPIVSAFQRLWPEARTTNLLEDSLAADLADAGHITDEMIERCKRASSILASAPALP